MPYVPPPLESARAKTQRARHNLERLASEIEDAENRTHGVSFVHEPETNELVIRALVPRDDFVRYGIVAGEIVGHARSALEHAVWEMVPAPSRETAFPVFTAKTAADAQALGRPGGRFFDREGRRMIDGISPAAAIVIEHVQPFGVAYQTNPLYVLTEMWNRDKHRLLNTCLSLTHAVSVRYHFPDGRIDGEPIIEVPEDVEHGTELFRKRHPGVGVQAGVDVGISTVHFADGPLAQKVVTTALSDLVAFAEQVVDDLARTM